MKNEIQSVAQNYGIARWGDGYFGINAEGHVSVRPDRAGAVEVDLHRLAHEIRDRGLPWPVLVRFVDILHDRVNALRQGFEDAARAQGYEGGYTAIYPIKVNQQRVVVEEILRRPGGGVGLEAGSKPELMAVLAMACKDGGTVVCNGYKDREYIRLALIGSRIVKRLFIVIEKPTELDLVLEESAFLGIEPALGVRVRLSASAAGKWQNSGGEKSKFGLSAGQVLALIERLKENGKLHWLQLLHTHMGSQVPNIRDIRRALGEVARYYAELRTLGAPIAIVDAGGGLGIDYEGTGTRHYCSTNYGLAGYGSEVTRALLDICKRHELPHPEIFTESGRAMTAHHAVLIVNVIERELAPSADAPSLAELRRHPVLEGMAELLEGVGIASPLEMFQEARQYLEEAHELFQRGELDLQGRATAEQAFFAFCHRLRPVLRQNSSRQRELLAQLDERLADKVFCNFSLFQSMPDVWAIDQVFPVLPLQRLNEPPETHATLHDLTCDSDGCLEQYVDQDGVETTIPVHETNGEPYLLGMFLIGAYQEILGDMHNLFGDTNAVNLELDGRGGYRLSQPERGDSVDELLSYVHFDPQEMLFQYRRKLEQTGLPLETRELYFVELKSGLFGYTYLED